jgi:hypothetical protein
MAVTLVRPYLAKSPRLPKDSSNWNSENVCHDITPCNVHYNLSSQSLTLVKYTNIKFNLLFSIALVVH